MPLLATGGKPIMEVQEVVALQPKNFQRKKKKIELGREKGGEGDQGAHRKKGCPSA